MHSEAPSKLDWTPITLHGQKTNDKYTDTHAKPLLNASLVVIDAPSPPVLRVMENRQPTAS